MIAWLMENGNAISIFTICAVALLAFFQSIKKDIVVSNNISIYTYSLLSFIVYVAYNLLSEYSRSGIDYGTFNIIWHSTFCGLFILGVGLINLLHKIYNETPMHLAVYVKYCLIGRVVNELFSLVCYSGFGVTWHFDAHDIIKFLLNMALLFGCIFILCFSRQVSNFIIWWDERKVSSNHQQA